MTSFCKFLSINDQLWTAKEDGRKRFDISYLLSHYNYYLTDTRTHTESLSSSLMLCSLHCPHKLSFCWNIFTHFSNIGIFYVPSYYRTVCYRMFKEIFTSHKQRQQRQQKQQQKKISLRLTQSQCPQVLFFVINLSMYSKHNENNEGNIAFGIGI